MPATVNTPPTTAQVVVRKWYHRHPRYQNLNPGYAGSAHRGVQQAVADAGHGEHAAHDRAGGGLEVVPQAP